MPVKIWIESDVSDTIYLFGWYSNFAPWDGSTELSITKHIGWLPDMNSVEQLCTSEAK